MAAYDEGKQWRHQNFEEKPKNVINDGASKGKCPFKRCPQENKKQKPSLLYLRYF